MEQRGQKIKNKENMMQRLSYNQTGAPEGKREATNSFRNNYSKRSSFDRTLNTKEPRRNITKSNC